MGVALLTIAAAFVFIGAFAGLIALLAAIVLALAIIYRVVMATDIED